MANSLPQTLETTTTHSYPAFRQLGAVLSHGLARISWAPVHNIAQNNILSYLSKLELGELTVVSAEGRTWKFGGGITSHFPELKAVLRINSSSFWVRVALFTDIGLAEAFITQEVDCDDVSSLLKILIINRSQLGQATSLAAPIASMLRNMTVLGFSGAISNTRANISSHYDIGNIMFSAYLSKDMNYSSAIFRDFNEDLRFDTRNKETIEDGQMRKMKAILAKAGIRKGDRVLEIGTGWGSLAILAAQTVDCTIVTITLSQEQTVVAQQRVADAGLSDRITIYNMDFRDCLERPEWQGAFDKFISVEMMEHVGKDYMKQYWHVVDWSLKDTTGVGVVQCITLPEARTPTYDRGVDFIQKHSMSLRIRLQHFLMTNIVFPGCYMPSLTFLMETLRDETQGRLIVDSVYNIGPHYARTLREWKRNFINNWKDIIAKALVGKYELSEQALEAFKRKWLYYFDYCEAGFATRSLGDHCITFTREGNVGFGCPYEIHE